MDITFLQTSRTLKRIASHVLLLPPGTRTSIPHAESHEEEFFFVQKGFPHLWINGYLYKMRPGVACGFAAGTGICHTVINDSKEDVILFILGEKTKSDNKYYYPLHNELKEEHKSSWWDNPPLQELGPHPGVPGFTAPTYFKENYPEYVIDCHLHLEDSTFHYPGDSETFGKGLRLSDKMHLRRLGIWYNELASNERSAYPHAHEMEDEGAYIIAGQACVWQHGNNENLLPGQFVEFPAGTGISHCIANRTSEKLLLIGYGDADELKFEERLTYPLHLLREKEMERKKFLWSNAPQLSFGKDRFQDTPHPPDHLYFTIASQDQSSEILDILKQSPEYFIKVDGKLPDQETVKLCLFDGPKKRGDNYFKEFLFIKHKGEAIGVCDLHANHPEIGVCYLGLLLLADNYKGKGLGKKIYALLEDYIKRALACKSIKLGVHEDNKVNTFWAKMGFQENGEKYTLKGEEKSGIVTEFEKLI